MHQINFFDLPNISTLIDDETEYSKFHLILFNPTLDKICNIEECKLSKEEKTMRVNNFITKEIKNIFSSILS